MDKILFQNIFAVLLIILVISIIIFDKKKINIIKEVFKKPFSFFYLLFTLFFYIFINYIINNKKINIFNISNQEHNRLKNISQQSLFALIIAIFAHLELFISPFWLIFFLLYFNILQPVF